MPIFGSIENKHGVNDPGYTPPVNPPDPPEPPEPPIEPAGPKKWHERWSWRLLIVIVALFLYAGWHAGTFDHILVNVGLNAKSCGRNGFGATFCGSELDEYHERLTRGKEEGEAAGHKIEEAASKAQHESQEYIQKAQESQHHYEEELKRSTESLQPEETESG